VLQRLAPSKLLAALRRLSWLSLVLLLGCKHQAKTMSDWSGSDKH
jgi:hypothetical protein